MEQYGSIIEDVMLRFDISVYHMEMQFKCGRKAAVNSDTIDRLSQLKLISHEPQIHTIQRRKQNTLMKSMATDKTTLLLQESPT